MFHRIQEYPLIDLRGRWRPRAYHDPRPDGAWDGWLVFFPLAGGVAIASGRPETTQSTFEALVLWAAGLTPVYLEGALVRALKAAEQPPLVSRLAVAEYEALEDAERLETAAAVDHAVAELDETAAAIARADADALRRERLRAESAVAASEEAAARLDAEMHEDAAREARAIAADAAKRRESVRAEVSAPKSATRTSKKRKK